MKNVVIILLLFLSSRVSSQVVTFCIAPSCPQALQMPVRADTVFAQLSASDGAKGITWSFVSGPNVPIMGTAIAMPNGSNLLQSALPISNLVAGTYIFKASGTSVTGSGGSANATVVIAPAPIACPIIPPPRTVVSVSYTAVLVNGDWTVKQTFNYSDGTTQ